MLKAVNSGILAVLCMFALLMSGACDPPQDNDNETSTTTTADTAAGDFGYVKAEDVKYSLGYGEMVTTPVGYQGINQTVIELFTSDQTWDSLTADMVGITLYHTEDTAPEGDYSVFHLVDDVWEGRFVCNIIINDGKNFAYDSGMLTYEPANGKYTISVEGTALCTTDTSEYPIEIEYSGPITQLN